MPYRRNCVKVHSHGDGNRIQNTNSVTGLELSDDTMYFPCLSSVLLGIQQTCAAENAEFLGFRVFGHEFLVCVRELCADRTACACIFAWLPDFF